MNNEEFIKAIKLFVRDSTISDIVDNLMDPPGRRPAKEVIKLSNWYNSMSDYDKEMAQKLISMAVDTSIFGLLAVVDGVRIVEETNGTFELYYVENGKTERLNKEEEYLHDIFQHEILGK